MLHEMKLNKIHKNQNKISIGSPCCNSSRGRCGDQVEDDTEILIRYNVRGRGPKFWTARYISLSCLRWLPTACHERLAYFHWPQWVTWLVTWWVTWSRSPDAGRHIGKFSLWTTLLRFSRSAQISLFSNFTKLGQLFFDNIFFGLTS